jgi:acetylglutamate kinase
VPAFFWRSQKNNPFNDWYIKVCDGMQISGTWRVFWKGLNAPELPSAILAAASAPVDFEQIEQKYN